MSVQTVFSYRIFNALEKNEKKTIVVIKRLKIFRKNIKFLEKYLSR